MRGLILSTLFFAFSQATYTNDSFVISESDFTKILETPVSVERILVVGLDGRQRERISLRFDELIRMYENARQEIASAQQKIELEEKRKRGEWEEIQNFNFEPRQRLEIGGNPGLQMSASGLSSGAMAQVAADRFAQFNKIAAPVKENGNKRGNKEKKEEFRPGFQKVPHDPAAYALALAQHSAAIHNSNEAQRALNEIEAQMLAKSKGRLDEHLQKTLQVAGDLENQSSKGVSQAEGDLFDLLNQINQRVDEGIATQKFCESSVLNYVVVSRIQFGDRWVSVEKPKSVIEALSQTQAELFRAKQKNLADRIKAIVPESFKGVEPTPLSVEEVERAEALVVNRNGDLKAQAFCHGVLSTSCVEAFIDEAGKADEVTRQEMSQRLQVALDRASLTTKIIFLKESKGFEPVKDSKLATQILEDFRKTIESAPLEVILGTLNELNSRGDASLAADLLQILLSLRKLDEDETREVRSVVKQLLVKKPHPVLLAAYIENSSPKDMAFILDRFSKLTSDSQVALTKRVLVRLGHWREALVEQARESANQSETVKVAKEFFNPLDESASSQIAMLKASIEVDSALAQTSLLSFAERVERVIPLLKANPKAQRELAISLSQIYLTGFGNTDSALRSLELYAGPNEMDFEAAAESLPEALNRIVELDAYDIEQEIKQHKLNQKFIDNAYLPAAKALKLEELSAEQKAALRSFARERSRLDQALSKSTNDLEQGIKDRASRIEALSKKWEDQFRAGPEEWFKKFDQLTEELKNAQ